MSTSDINRYARSNCHVSTRSGSGLFFRPIYHKLHRGVSGRESVIGLYALVLDAPVEEARAWYLRLNFGFHPLLDNLHHLHLSVETIRQRGVS